MKNIIYHRYYMGSPDFARTTFIYRAENLWRFKQIAVLKRKKIRDVTCELMNRFIEDSEDEMLYNHMKKLAKDVKNYVEWKDLKRRMGLDGLQDFN